MSFNATITILALCFTLSARPAQALQLFSHAASAPGASAIEALVKGPGASLGLDLGPEGLLFKRFDPATQATLPVPLDAAASAKVFEYLSMVPKDQAPATHVKALQAYLGEGRSEALDKTAFVTDADGRKALSPIGKNLLVDILSAKDGTAFKEEAAKPASGVLVAKLQLGSFDWDRFEAAEAKEVASAFAVDGGRQTVRLLVAANNAAAKDRDSVDSEDSSAVLAETGLSAALVASHGAKVVRAVDNMVVLEVPLEQAAALGRSLKSEGVESRPARAFHAPATQSFDSASASGGSSAQGAGSAGAAQPVTVEPMNAESHGILGADQMWKAGMDGKGALVGVIDTGLDLNHPDFQKSVKAFFDLTGEGHADVHGHGTHVAGSIAGSGEASNGRYKGMAPGAKLAVFKVFDKNGNTSEDTILVAMKHAAAIGVQVLNMSLGGPGDPESDPLSQMANRLVVKNNVLVVTSSGNSGPESGTIGAPGNAEYAMSVTGTDKKGDFPFYTSRGDVEDSHGRTYLKPDISAVAGGVDIGNNVLIAGDGQPSNGLTSAPVTSKAGDHCVYSPGVISARSSDDPDLACAVPGNPKYRYMSGTSMAAPMAAGIAANVIGWLEKKGTDYKAVEVKAAIMETAKDLGQSPEVQGSGLINGGRLASTVQGRAALGLPVGNVAYMLSMRLTSTQRERLSKTQRYAMTPLGVWDGQEGRLINDDTSLRKLSAELDALTPPVLALASAGI